MISNSNHIKTIFQTNLIWATTAHRSAVAKRSYFLLWSDSLFQFDQTYHVFFYKKKKLYKNKRVVVKNMVSRVQDVSI